MLREFLMREVIGPVAKAFQSDEPELRVSLVGSQTIGPMMARHIVELEPLTSLPAERVVEMVGPTLQRYLVRPLTQKDRRQGRTSSVCPVCMLIESLLHQTLDFMAQVRKLSR